MHVQYHGGIGAPLLTIYRLLAFGVFCFVVIYKVGDML